MCSDFDMFCRGQSHERPNHSTCLFLESNDRFTLTSNTRNIKFPEIILTGVCECFSDMHFEEI